MKTAALVLCLMFSTAILAQKKGPVTELTERTYLLNHTVFGTKDSLTLEHLFASRATYGHSGGKFEDRYEAIKNIYLNRSVYADTAIGDVMVMIKDDVASVRHSFKATETKADGSSSNLNLGILLVWVREKGEWKLFARQAVKLAQ